MKAIFIILTILLSAHVSAGDFAQFYYNDYDGFWKQWNKGKDAAITCLNENDTGAYLSGTISTLRIVEVTEANADVIEKLALSDPRCLLNGLNTQTDANASLIIKTFLVHTLFQSPNAIEASISKVWNVEKYSRLRDIYAKIK